MGLAKTYTVLDWCKDAELGIFILSWTGCTTVLEIRQLSMVELRSFGTL